MITPARRLFFALTLAGLGGLSARGDAIRYSTTGTAEDASGPVAFTGVRDATVGTSRWYAISLGSIPGRSAGRMGLNAAIHVRFDFTGDLPPIEVSGTIKSVGYNWDESVVNSVVTTSATEAQRALYPVAFQSLIDHPDWFNTTSFDNGISPTLAIGASIHPYDAFEMRPIPEPSAIVAFGLIAAGLGWRFSRRRRQ